MPFGNYGELKTAISAFNWARDAGNIPDFVALAHSEINLGLRAPFMEKTADVVINAARVAAPADFEAVTRLWIDDNFDTPLSPTTPDRLQAFRAQYPSGGRPQWYTIEGESDDLSYFVFAPSPATATSYTGKLLYTRNLAFFANDAATNIVLTKYPGLYLDGALWQASLFSDDTARVGQFGPMFESLMARINLQKRQQDALSGGAPEMTSPYVV